MKLKDLENIHPYYCSESSEPIEFPTFADYYDEWHDADPEYNLLFRWDIYKREESERYYAEVFYMLQRKGRFVAVRIHYIDDADVPKFMALMTKHWEHLKQVWLPLSETKSETTKGGGVDF